MASEKYRAYLCSREWGLRRQAVHERAGGICERCKRNEGYAVHHKTYARVYHEPLTDLILLCEACHDFTHGRDDHDPADVPLEPVRVYMAGAVVEMSSCPMVDAELGTCEEVNLPMIDSWRDNVFGSCDKHGGVQEVGTLAGRFIYGGPTIESGGGHGMACEDEDTHLAERCLVELKLCDVVFAWIGRDETVGTIVEIGAARAFGIPVFVAFFSEHYARRFYFAAQLADARVIAQTPVEAWQSFLEWCEEEDRSWWGRDANGLNRKRDRELYESLDLVDHITRLRHRREEVE